MKITLHGGPFSGQEVDIAADIYRERQPLKMTYHPPVPIGDSAEEVTAEEVLYVPRKYDRPDGKREWRWTYQKQVGET